MLRDWKSVHAELLRRIRDREWQPGAAIPAEAELARRFGCSRTTVNRAMRALADAGLVERRRKAGSRVSEHPVGRARLDIPVIRKEVEQRGQAWHCTLLERRLERPPPVVAGRMQVPANSELLFLRSLHFADGNPLLFEDRWINCAELPQALETDFTQISANEWLVRNARYTTGEMLFSAVNATAKQAELLSAEPGSALFVAERLTWNEERAITLVHLYHAPGYRMRAAL